MNNNLKRDFYKHNRNKETMTSILIYSIAFILFALLFFRNETLVADTSGRVLGFSLFDFIFSLISYFLMYFSGGVMLIGIVVIGCIWLVKVRQINRVIDENNQEVFEDYATMNKRKYEKYILGKDPSNQTDQKEDHGLMSIVVILIICIVVLIVSQLAKNSQGSSDNAHIYFKEEKVHYALTPQYYLEKRTLFWKTVERMYLSTSGQKTKDDHQIIVNRCLLESVGINRYNLDDANEYSRGNVEGLIGLFNVKGYEDDAWNDGIKFSKRHSGTDGYTVNYSLIYYQDNPGECSMEIIDESTDKHVVFTLEINHIGEKKVYSEPGKRVTFYYETELVYKMETEEGSISYVVMDSIDKERNELVIENVSFSSIGNQRESFEEFKRLAGILESELYELLGTDE